MQCERERERERERDKRREERKKREEARARDDRFEGEIFAGSRAHDTAHTVQSSDSPFATLARYT